MADDDMVKVKIAFAADHTEQGKTQELPAADAARLVREGRAAYATDAQERKADKALGVPPAE